MTRRLAFYLTGTLALVSLAGCGRGLFQVEQRAPWRAEAEAACASLGLRLLTPRSKAHLSASAVVAANPATSTPEKL